MGRAAVATLETVLKALEELGGEGAVPSVEAIRTRLGGGSYSTISRLLRDIVKAGETRQVQASELPDAIAEIGRQAAASIYAAVTKQARQQLESAEAAAQARIDEAEGRLRGAELEIERLEKAVEAAAEDAQEREEARQAAQEQAARSDAALAACQEARRGDADRAAGERSQLAQDVAAAREAERQARDQTARLEGIVSELRAQLAAATVVKKP